MDNENPPKEDANTLLEKLRRLGEKRIQESPPDRVIFSRGTHIIGVRSPEPKTIPVKAPWYESAVFWGLFSLGCAIVLTVVAAMKHDIRWLLWLAAPFFVVSAWSVLKGWLHGRMLVVSLSVITIAIVGGLGWMYVWLRPTDVSAPPPSLGSQLSASAPSQSSPDVDAAPKKTVNNHASKQSQKNSGNHAFQQQSSGDNSPNITQQGSGNSAVVNPKFTQNVLGNNNVGIQAEQVNIGTDGRLLAPDKYTQLVTNLKALEKGTAFLVLHEPITKEMNRFGGQLQAAFKDAGWALPATSVDISHTFLVLNTDHGVLRNTSEGIHCVLDGSSLANRVAEVLSNSGVDCTVSPQELYPPPSPQPTITLFLGRSLN